MEAIDRLKAPTPKYFKNIMKIAGVLVALAVAILGAHASGTLEISEDIVNACKWISVIGGVIIGNSSMAKEDAPIENS